MAKIELELNDEMHTRLQSVATKVALSPEETAKMILAHELASERKIDWLEVIRKARALLSRVI